MTADGITLGAYALQPAAEALAGREAEWYAALAGIEGAHEFEVPLRGGELHFDGAERLAELLPDGWHVVITMLPATMAGIRASDGGGSGDGYGLASPDDEGRAAALADVRAALDEAERLADATGRATVTAVHLTSAPRGGGSAERLATSLAELGPRAHELGIGLLIEHCDAWSDERPMEKGFLRLDDEIAAVLAARDRTAADLGQTINWGRSAIDARSADGPTRQLATLREAGTLAGLMFSGASETGGALGGPWADVHNPVDTADASSLLTAAAIAALTSEYASDLAVIGVKVSDPARATDFGEHLEPLRATVAPVAASLASGRQTKVTS